MSTTNGVAGALTLATILTAQPFGFSVETIAIGTGFAVLGVMGRAAVDLQDGAQQGGSRKLSSMLGWIGGGLIGAPFVTVLYLVILKLTGIQSDGVAVLGLVTLGYSGPKGVTWLFNTGMGLLPKRLGAPPPGPDR